MGKLKVAMIVTGFPSPDNPSHGVFNFRAANSLANYVDLTVIQLRIWKPGRKFAKQVSDSPYKHYTISSPYLPAGNKFFVCKLINMYRKIGDSLISDILKSVDIFHSVGASFSGALGSIWAGKYGKRNVLQLIGTDVNSELPGLLHLKCFKFLRDNTYGVGCNSQGLKLRYEDLFGEPENIKVVYRGIDVDEYKYSFDNFGDGKTKFLFLGGIPFYKHLDAGRNLKGGITLMETWKQYSEEFTKLNCELVFAGPDSNSDKANTWRNSLKNKENVFLKGSLTQEEALEEYNKAHIVLIPSLEEGMPNVALEAGATGKCVIASNVGGIPELIKNDENGILINPDDPGSLADAMITCAKDKQKVERLGLNLRKTIEENFNSKNFAPGYMGIYEKALQLNLTN
jgi:glycosyltransferase involved in cell wall biosynthesis